MDKELLSAAEIEMLLKGNYADSNEDDRPDLERIFDFPLRLSVCLGQTIKSVGELISLNSGAVVELGRYLSSPIDILVNGKLIARGEVVVIEDNFGIRITQILSPEDRLKELGKK